MKTENNKIEEQITNAIRQVGRERDMKDLDTLRHFCSGASYSHSSASIAEVTDKYSLDESDNTLTNKTSKPRFKKIILGVSSIAAIILLVFSLNIYLEYQQMDKAFITYYSPLEYDSTLSSRGAVTLSPKLTVAMEAYNKADYTKTLQLFENITLADKDYLIYKAISFIETKQLSEAIALLEKLVEDGEGSSYYQDANWYLANAYLKNHDKKKALSILSVIELSDGMYADKAKEMIKMLQ